MILTRHAEKRPILTVTSTLFQTITRIATQQATVVLAEIQKSTVVATIEVTVSNAATQTNVVWATATALAKREISSPASSLFRRQRPKEETLIRSGRSYSPENAAPIPRQASQGATSTVTSLVTHITDVTSTSSIIVTTHTTSTILTTIYQTNTRYAPHLTLPQPH